MKQVFLFKSAGTELLLHFSSAVATSHHVQEVWQDSEDSKRSRGNHMDEHS